MNMKTCYRIDGDDNQFRSLRAAKHHIWIAYTDKERLELNGSSIVKVVNDEVVTMTPIFVTSDGYSFGKTVRL